MSAPSPAKKRPRIGSPRSPAPAKSHDLLLVFGERQTASGKKTFGMKSCQSLVWKDETIQVRVGGRGRAVWWAKRSADGASIKFSKTVTACNKEAAINTRLQAFCNMKRDRQNDVDHLQGVYRQLSESLLQVGLSCDKKRQKVLLEIDHTAMLIKYHNDELDSANAARRYGTMVVSYDRTAKEISFVLRAGVRHQLPLEVGGGTPGTIAWFPCDMSAVASTSCVHKPLSTESLSATVPLYATGEHVQCMDSSSRLLSAVVLGVAPGKVHVKFGWNCDEWVSTDSKRLRPIHLGARETQLSLQ